MSSRSLEELVNVDAPAWPGLRVAFGTARNPVEILPPDRVRCASTLEALQVTVRSTLGAIAYETGGVLIDHGWLRLLGGGCERAAGLADWNGLAGQPRVEGASGLCIVGYDLIGGFFALDGRADGEAIYFAPDTLGWERLERGYTGLVQFLLGGDLDGYYPLRWSGWQQEAEGVPFDLALSSRRGIPARQVWSANQTFAEQLGGPR